MRKAREAGVANQKADYDRWLAEARAAGVSAARAERPSSATSRPRARRPAARKPIASASSPATASAKASSSSRPATAPRSTSPLCRARTRTTPHWLPASRELAAKLLERASACGARRQDRADRGGSRAGAPLGRGSEGHPGRQQAIPAAKNAARHAACARQAPSSGAADLQSKLKRTRYDAPEYPERALHAEASAAPSPSNSSWT